MGSFSALVRDLESQWLVATVIRVPARTMPQPAARRSVKWTIESLVHMRAHICRRRVNWSMGHHERSKFTELR